MPSVLSTLGASASLAGAGLSYWLVMAPHMLGDILWTFAPKLHTTGVEDVAVAFSEPFVQLFQEDREQSVDAVRRLFENYRDHIAPYLSHTVLSLPWLLFPLQFVGPLRRRYPRLHTFLGTALLGSLAASSVTGMWLGFHSSYGMHAFLPGLALGAVSLHYIRAAWAAARAKDYKEHQLRATQLSILMVCIPASRFSSGLTWRLSRGMAGNKGADVAAMMAQNVPSGLWIALGGSLAGVWWYEGVWREKFGAEGKAKADKNGGKAVPGQESS